MFQSGIICYLHDYTCLWDFDFEKFQVLKQNAKFQVSYWLSMLWLSVPIVERPMALNDNPNEPFDQNMSL